MSAAQEQAEARRQLIQQVLTHPDAIADLLLSLLDRVERLEWDLPSTEREPTALTEVKDYVDRSLRLIREIDQVTLKRR